MRERTDGEGFATRAIHAGERPDPVTHAHNTPIYATATFAFDTAAEKEDAVDRAMAWDPTAYFYSRTGNPTNRALEEKIASLEGAEDCVVAASGMASVAATLFAHLSSGDHLVVGDELFAITTVLMEEDLPRRGIAVTAVDTTDLAAVEAAITPATRLLFLECSTNPRLRIADLDAITAMAHRHGVTVVADNTFLGPGAAAPDRARRGPRAARRDEIPVGSRRRGLGRGLRLRGADRADPQADRHVRPGGEPVRELPRAAGRPDAAAAVRQGLGERGPTGGVPGSRSARRVGPLPGSRVASRSRGCDPDAGRPLRGDGHVPAARRRPGDVGVHRPPPAVRHRREPGRRVHARLPAAEARRADPRLRGLRGHRGPAWPTSSSACPSSSSAVLGSQPGRPALSPGRAPRRPRAPRRS